MPNGIVVQNEKVMRGINTDLNTLFDEGRYAIGSQSIANLPPNSFGVGTLMIFDCLVYTAQIYTDMLGSAFYRISTDKSTWQSWYPLNLPKTIYDTREWSTGSYNIPASNGKYLVFTPQTNCESFFVQVSDNSASAYRISGTGLSVSYSNGSIVVSNNGNVMYGITVMQIGY